MTSAEEHASEIFKEGSRRSRDTDLVSGPKEMLCMKMLCMKILCMKILLHEKSRL